VPLTPGGWENAVDTLRERLGLSAMAAFGGASGGTIQQIGGAFEWTHTSGLGVQTVVTASPRGERTRLRMTQLVGLASPRAEGIAYGTVIAAVLTLMLAAVLVKTGVDGLALAASLAASFVASLAVAAPVTTSLDRRWRSRKLGDLERLADDVAARLAMPDPAYTADPAALPTGAAAEKAPLRDAFEAMADLADPSEREAEARRTRA
jgi:hypothetical protein